MAKDYCTCIECGKRVSDPEYIRYGGLCQECYEKVKMKAKRKQYEIDSKKYRFIPGYYEWHLIDDKGKVLYVMQDPSEELFNEQIECETLDDVRGVIEGELDTERQNWITNYEGNVARHALIPFDELPKSTCEIMARALYDYYVANAV